jgi:HSP20 family molecular chaperone IbpA
MPCLHTAYRRVTVTALLVAAGLFSPLIAPAGAAPFGGARDTAECALDIRRSADPEAYYLQIGFDGAAAPEVSMRVRGRLLRIQVRQGADRQAAACHTRFYKSLTLPRDADPRRIQRQDESGRVLIIIPRREPYWR